MMYAPVVLFVYNRPEHTLKTLEALSENIYADKTTLYIYADGPKADCSFDDLNRINKTRDIIKGKNWCKQVKIVESNVNRGLADSIVNGVTEIVTKYKKIIVLEDDIVTSPGFLKYMNDALCFYEGEDSVMHLSAYLPSIKLNIKSETFFFNQTSCWGWGTWERAWKYYDNNARFLAEEIYNSNRLYEFNLNNSYPFMEHLKANISGEMKTWAIKWYASVFLKNGLCLHPYISLVRNIGFDGSGENCFNDMDMMQQKIAKSVTIKKIELKESFVARQAVVNYNKPQNSYTFYKTIVSKFKRSFLKHFL